MITYQKLDSLDMNEHIVNQEEEKQNGTDDKNFQAANVKEGKENGLAKTTSSQSAPTPTDNAESPGPKRRMSRADRAAAKAAQ